MTKPDDVPNDIWEKAYEAHQLILNTTIPSEAGAVYRIARALIAEREACAQVVDTMAEVIMDESKEGDWLEQRRASSAQVHAVQAAAAAIRDRSQT